MIDGPLDRRGIALQLAWNVEPACSPFDRECHRVMAHRLRTGLAEA